MDFITRIQKFIEFSIGLQILTMRPILMQLIPLMIGPTMMIQPRRTSQVVGMTTGSAKKTGLTMRVKTLISQAAKE